MAVPTSKTPRRRGIAPAPESPVEVQASDDKKPVIRVERRETIALVLDGDRTSNQSPVELAMQMLGAYIDARARNDGPKTAVGEYEFTYDDLVVKTTVEFPSGLAF